MKTRHYLTILALALMLAMATVPIAKAAAYSSPLAMQEPLAPTAAERELYTRGQNLYLQGNYTQSAEVLVSFLQTYPNSIIKDLALLWLGRAYYRVGKFVEAEEVGKRLRSIKDTPFADIYDAELTTARREAAQLSRARAESKRQPAAPGATSRVTSPNGRSRYVESSGEKPAAPAALNMKREAPVATKPSRTRTVAGDLTRQQAKSVAGKTTRPSTTNKGTTRAKSGPAPLPGSSVANRAPQRSARSAATVRKPVATTTSQRSGQGTQRTVAKPKAPTSSRNPAIAASHSAGARGPAVRPPQVRSASSSSNVSANERVATGGLYSLIEAAGETASGRPTLPARVDARSKRITAGPGEVVYLSFVVRNPESIKRTYELRISAPGAPEAKLFVDSNGDGIHQGDELPVTGAPVVELKNSEVPFLLEITIPRSAFEGQQYSYTVTVLSVDSGAVVATATSTLTVSSIRARLLPAESWAGKSVLSL